MTGRWRIGGGLRFSTRLRLAFAAVAAVPLVAVPLVIRSVGRSYDAAFERQLGDAARLVRSEVERQRAEVKARAERIAAGPLTQDVARALEEADPSALVGLAAPVLAENGLDVLEVIDANGRILSSGHVPARFGDTDAAALALLGSAPGQPTLASVEVAGDEIRQELAWVVAVPAEPGPPGAGVLAGRLFDARELERLGELVGGRVSLPDSGTEAPSAPTTWQGRLLGQASTVQQVSVASAAGERMLRIHLSDKAFSDAKAGIFAGALLTFAVALLAGVVLARLLSRGLVAPVEALVAGTRELARGDLSHRVDTPARGELKQLVDAFNQMAADLALSRDRLAQAERIAAWEQIARALAHEIKNPLTPISMAIETLQRTRERNHPEFDRFFREGTATVLEEVARLKRLATEFGEFARWPKPLASPVPPAELVRGAAALYASPPPKITVEVEAEAELPLALADRDQIQRALVNLVKNAIEAMPGGGRIVLRARAFQDAVALEVADSGPGIPGELRGKVFTPYFTTKAEGTGLGLAIVQRIAGEHGGRVEVEDTPGGGTTFRLVIPVAARPAAAA